MRIKVSCSACDYSFAVSDQVAGKRCKCPTCGAAVSVPAADDFDDLPSKAPPRRSTSSGRVRKKSQSSGSKAPAVMGGVLVSVLAVIGVGIKVGARVLRNWKSDTPAAADAEASTPYEQLSVNTVRPDDVSAEELARRKQQYEQSLNQQRATNSQSSYTSLVNEFGADKVATVVFSDVIGETTDADKYLNRKVFRASYHDYSQSSQQAQQQTEANKKSAEAAAVAEHQKTWGDNAFGPMFVQYRYQVVRSDLPYPRVVNGGRIDNTCTYHVAPVLNVSEFAGRIGIGEVTQIDGRTVNVRSNLPVPIPDPDVEELVLQHGSDRVIAVKVQNAPGDSEQVQFFFQMEIEKLGDSAKRVALAGVKALGNGEYTFSVAPFETPTEFASRLPWAELVETDAATRSVSLKATLPEKLPTQADMLAEQKRRRDEEKAIRDADWDQRPRPGESEVDWALRALDDRSHWTREKVLKALSTMPVDEARRQEVSKALIARLEGHSSTFGDHLAAMAHWKTDETVGAIMRMSGNSANSFSTHREAIMKALVELGTEECAVALASGIQNWSAGDDSVRYLIQMGSIAEKPLHIYLLNQDDRVRTRVYSVLEQIGTSASLTKLKSNLKLERTPLMKELCQRCMDAIKERETPAAPAAAETTEENPFKPKADEASPFKPKTDDESPFKPKDG